MRRRGVCRGVTGLPPRIRLGLPRAQARRVEVPPVEIELSGLRSPSGSNLQAVYRTAHHSRRAALGGLSAPLTCLRTC
jgi:hypothetical protein